MKQLKIYTTILILTFIVALSPLLIGDTAAYNTIYIETVQTHYTLDDGRIIEDPETPLGQANSSPVPESFFWLILAFAMLLFVVFVYMSYRRKMADPDEDPATASLDDESSGMG